MNNNPRVGIGVFVWKDGKFFMGKRKGSHGHNTWSVPGGHLEYGESIEDCAVREALEETGMKVKYKGIVAITEDLFPEDNKHYVTIWVDTNWVSGQPQILEPDKWIGGSWQNFSSLPSPLFEPCWKNLKKVRPDLFK